MIPFRQFLRQRLESGGFSTEDVLVSFLPLAHEVLAIHESGAVALLEGSQHIAAEPPRLRLDGAAALPPRRNPEQLRSLDPSRRRAVDVQGEFQIVSESLLGLVADETLPVQNRDDPLTRPVYLPGYRCWEHAAGHHDPVTDVFSLGLILASLACGIDLEERPGLEKFVAARRNLFAIAPTLHPVLAKAIMRMTDLDRSRRPQDLRSLLHSLQSYRDQSVDVEFDLARVPGFRDAPPRDRRRRVLSVLQKRLFELNRRNRLLHFRSTMQTVNLTWASVPLSFDVEHIRPDQILTWNTSLQKTLCSGKPLPLSNYLNFEEALYLPGSLERIRSESRRDQAEFGFASLRLVLCFLRWSNLKEAPHERLDSPLALLPVDLVRKRGVRDVWQLEVRSTEAEINPVLRHCFRQWYDVTLPEAIDLETTSLDSLYEFLAAHIQSTEPGVSVEKIERSRIHLLHAGAKRRLEQYRRRAGLDPEKDTPSEKPQEPQPAPAEQAEALPPNPVEQPAGPPGESPAESRREVTGVACAIDSPTPLEPPQPDPLPQSEQRSAASSRRFYSPAERDSGNPYHWEFDLCSVTLGTFRYRRMSLVRDYETLLEQGNEHPAFDSVFSLAPRPAGLEAPPHPALEERFPVVPSDPTQAAAVAFAGTGRSYIIQGPPGTGKSQSITNLIADFVARGRRVLFVCEKRAAIDVVFHRLKQRGLASLCCLIHDSQADKKEFILDLKATYESLLSSSEPDDAAENARDAILRSLRSALDPLTSFDAAMSTAPDVLGIPVREAMLRGLRLQHATAELSPRDEERIPLYGQWSGNADKLDRIRELMCEIAPDGVLARNPHIGLASRVASESRPIDFVAARIDRASELLEKIEPAWPNHIATHPVTTMKADAENPSARRRTRSTRETSAEKAPDVLLDFESVTLETMMETARLAEALREWARQSRSALLVENSEQSRALELSLAQRRILLERVDAARREASAWKEVLSSSDTKAALQSAAAFESDPVRWLKPSWWRLRGLLQRNYDFRAHPVRRTWRQALLELDAVHAGQSAVDAADSAIRHEFRFQGDVGEFLSTLESLRVRMRQGIGPAYAVCRALLTSSDANAALLTLANAQGMIFQLSECLAELLHDSRIKTLGEILSTIDRIDESLDQLPESIPCLAELETLPAELSSALRSLPVTLEQMEAASIRRTLDRLMRADRTFGKFSARSRERLLLSAADEYDRIFEVTASVVLQRVRQRFREHVRLSQAANGGLTAEQKEFKTRYSAGRKELEHEFGKTTRYKSIRDLVSGDSGRVVQDLKPVWLMSPLSVSDTLPLAASHVDVVIFDEASQITLEEAIPSAFRAPQMIVVGDEMQLPPTNFFASRGGDESLDEEPPGPASGSSPSQGGAGGATPDDLAASLLPDDSPHLAPELEADSFLTHASRNLPSAMLGWHYRSRSESLISFSNATFYQGRLLTVPEEERIPDRRDEIVARSSSDGAIHVASVLDRPLSLHRIEHGIYQERRNTAEAEYIAHMVRGLLSRNATGESPLSLGIIAFSQAQQEEIEQALGRLADSDSEFRDRLDAEWEREVDGQFVGLLVKNLENIQGDERDIIILSVCYAPDASGRMRMNFGPINQSGGEKRLNVAFSRAKSHMALVSTIRHHQVTNEYNTGANTLRNYLKYAEAMSVGDLDAAQRVLGEMNTRGTGSAAAVETDLVVEQIATALRSRGYGVELNVGQSHFRCDLAVYRDGDAKYRLGILVDTAAHYRQPDVLERDILRPRLLRTFGWNVTQVLTKDWYSDRNHVLAELSKQLEPKK